MANIKLLISYDGTDFVGWQKQARGRSVQGNLEEALADLHGHPVRLTGAGRTDAGVHAYGQVANFTTDKTGIPAEKFREAINCRLDQDLRVLSSQEVPCDFHACRDASLRLYEYRLWEGRNIPVPLYRYTWQVPKLPSLGLLNDLSAVLTGIHDFSTFTAAGDANKSKTREIYQAVFLSEGPLTIFRIAGKSFLWRMVRSLLGSLVDLGLRHASPETLRRILLACDRSQAGPTAPSQGLFLSKVNYGSDTGIR